MGFLDNAKDAAEAAGKKVGEFADDTKERVSDKVDEVKADAEVKRAEGDVKRAEAERDSTKAKNEFKEDLRN
ncbi:hypothetical protein [Salinibacterium sp.]|uniref:hypothetical protein n=1 Tax=Salinibacterium sp. TaxID=1915057 RepID=UPI00286CBC93|nr:hypothetical protein [Salinibacterium sp.]